MKKFLISILFLILSSGLMAEEGMWIPSLLEQLNISQMQSLGLKLSAEDIYSVNNSSLKDAIVLFGGGCTAAFISPDGLLLTNHHCALGTIQRLSSLEHDYLTNGFWAKSFEEELPAPGLTVTLLIRMEDVTDRMLKNVGDEMNQIQRREILLKNQEEIEKTSVKGTSYEGKVRSFFYGNQYYLFITQTFKDIRLAGAPPQGIGQFGGDTDNWMWPRHGGDFSLFRVYVDADNNPAVYSKENRPYHPKRSMPVSLKGYQPGDFTFVFGYPGTTKEYLTSYGVDLIAEKENPVRTSLREKRLDIINSAMNDSKQLRIQYTSKHQGIANGWKKMVGETKGIRGMDGISRKRSFEKRFQTWADSVGKQSSYDLLLPAFEKTYNQFLPLDMANVYLTEAGMSVEIIRFAAGFRELVRLSKSKVSKPDEIRKAADKLLNQSQGFFKDYAVEVDRQIFVPMLETMAGKMEKRFQPCIFDCLSDKFDNNFTSYGNYIYSKTFFTDSAKTRRLLKEFRKGDHRKIEKDPAFHLAVSIYERYELDVQPLVSSINDRIDSLHRIYMKAQMEMEKGKRFYPDANSTLRVSYGQVKNYQPKDAVTYNYFTTSKGILEKEDPRIFDYAIDPSLKKLFLDRDFGKYADKDGTLHIAFTATNHTTGGNSGSPVLDGNGNLIGLNFDRNWEGTMSDLMYDPDQCRNITLDIRYCIFVIDKYAGAERLIREMKIIE